MILQQLGIFGWKEADQNLVLASLLTGDLHFITATLSARSPEVS
jgi:hypothetical protein